MLDSIDFPPELIVNSTFERFEAYIAERISYYTREIDRLHPFGYGTKETLFVYFKQILGRLRYKVDYEAVSEEAWEEARAAGMDDDLSKYEEIYKAIITKIPREKKK